MMEFESANNLSACLEKKVCIRNRLKIKQEWFTQLSTSEFKSAHN